MNRNRQKYIISVFFTDHTKKNFVRYFKGDYKLKPFLKK